MIRIRISRAALFAASMTVLAVVGSAVLAPARAADRQPLVLDTQRGISDGQSGIVLQNAPLSRAPMVGAQPAARPAELGSNASPPMIVAPYVQVPGASGQTKQQSRPQRRSRSRSTGRP